MNETIREWITKAEEDFSVMTREMRVRKAPSYNAVCFHAQQCIEKLMKSLLIYKKALPPKKHDLLELNELLKKCGVNLDVSREQLRLLSIGAVVFRYPGESADKLMARDAVKVCRQTRKAILSFLPSLESKDGSPDANNV